MSAEELDHAMSSPEAMAAAVDAHKIDLVFHLWDTDADGVASRKKLTRALTWYYRRVTTLSLLRKAYSSSPNRTARVDVAHGLLACAHLVIQAPTCAPDHDVPQLSIPEIYQLAAQRSNLKSFACSCKLRSQVRDAGSVDQQTTWHTPVADGLADLLTPVQHLGNAQLCRDLRGLRMRRLLSQVQEESKPGEVGGRRSEVIDFLEREQRPGLPGLDRGAFRALVQRFCELSGLPAAEVGRLMSLDVPSSPLGVSARARIRLFDLFGCSGAAFLLRWVAQSHPYFCCPSPVPKHPATPLAAWQNLASKRGTVTHCEGGRFS